MVVSSCLNSLDTRSKRKVRKMETEGMYLVLTMRERWGMHFCSVSGTRTPSEPRTKEGSATDEKTRDKKRRTCSPLGGNVLRLSPRKTTRDVLCRKQNHEHRPGPRPDRVR